MVFYKRLNAKLCEKHWSKPDLWMLLPIITFIFLLMTFSLPVYAENTSSPETIQKVQIALNEAGYDCGNPDGIAGNATRAAITAFRADKHLGDSTEIDGTLLTVLGVSDVPSWDSFHSLEDMQTVRGAGDGYLQLLSNALIEIGATRADNVTEGNFVQTGVDSFSVGFQITSDNESLLLATMNYTGEWNLESIRNFDTGEYYYYKGSQDGIQTTAYHASTVAPSLTLSGMAENSQASGKSGATSQTDSTVQTESQSQQTAGTTYVLNKNTKKFHLLSCSSVNDIKASNRWDYTGSREEIIAMGYVPCKRCYP